MRFFFPIFRAAKSRSGRREKGMPRGGAKEAPHPVAAHPAWSALSLAR